MLKGKGVNWVTNAADSRPIPLDGEGLATRKPETVMNAFKERVRKTPNKVLCLQAIRLAFTLGQMSISVKRDGVWKAWTWKEYYDDVIKFAKALISLGFQPHQCVSILGFNTPGKT